MTDFLTALALAVTIEGMVYALFPTSMRNMMAQMQTLPDRVLRLAGISAAVVGVVLVALIRRS